MKPEGIRILQIWITGRNSMENPIGIETNWKRNVPRVKGCRNSMENPIGIETIARTPAR